MKLTAFNLATRACSGRCLKVPLVGIKGLCAILLCGVLFFLGSVNSASAWGPEGHQAVAELARTLLSGKAHTAITNILGNDDLATVATWADEVRAASRGQGPLVHDPEAIAFNQAQPHNDQWHFVNLPLGSTNYTDKGAFSSSNDVVHAINRCVAVLEGKSKEFTKLQALRLLVHFVGDIHQPLHVGSGYYNVDDNDTVTLIVDPAKAGGKPDDVGGNDLFFGPGPYDELHGYWDGSLVEKVDNTSSYHNLASYLAGKVDTTNWITPGNYHQWAEQWAGDSVQQAAAAYSGLTFSNPVFNTHRDLRKISITLPGNYEADQTLRVEQQLAKAGYHLAELLNHIKWK